MKVFVNEVIKNVKENISAFEIKEIYNDKSDIVIVNGFPIKDDLILNEQDRVTLIEKGVVPSKMELEAVMISRHTPKVYSKLKKGKVVVFGLGGLGSNVALSLARIGVGELVLIDYDVVEPSNLNRQQYYVCDIGKPKTTALKEHLSKVNPFINVTTLDMFMDKNSLDKCKSKDIFNDVDIIVEAFDDPRSKAELCSYVLKYLNDKYLVAASGMAGYYDSNLIQTKKIKEKFYICGDFINEAKIGDGLMAPRVAICANHMANLVTRILIQKHY